MDEEAYWRRYRAYVRRKASAQAAPILLPILIVLSFVLTVVLPVPAYPPDDQRANPVFRLSLMIAFDALAVAGTLFAIRWLQADRRGEKRPRREEPGRR